MFSVSWDPFPSYIYIRGPWAARGKPEAVLHLQYPGRVQCMFYLVSLAFSRAGANAPTSPAQYHLAVLEAILMFILAPLPGGSRGRVRTVIFLGQTMVLFRFRGLIYF